MTRLLMCGFEQGSLGVFDSTSAGTIHQISAVQKRSGVYSYKYQCSNAAPSYGRWTLPSSPSEVYMKVGLYIVSKSATDSRNAFLTLRDSAGTENLSFRIKGTGEVQVLRGSQSGGTLIATGTTVLAVSAWYLISIRALIADVGGRVEVRIEDGASEIDFTGDTKATANANVHFLSVGGDWITAVNCMVAHIDDVALNDIAGAVNNSWPSQAGIYGIVPMGVGNYAEWAPSAGANWDCVNEVPPSDLDYVSDSVSGQKDSYAMGNTPGLGSMPAVCYWARAKKDLAGDLDLKRLFRIAGFDYSSAALPLPTVVAYVKEILENSPATGVPFTSAEIDAMEVGQEVA